MFTYVKDLVALRNTSSVMYKFGCPGCKSTYIYTYLYMYKEQTENHKNKSMNMPCMVTKMSSTTTSSHA